MNDLTKPAITIGQEPTVTLKRPNLPATDKPYFLDATVLPGKGMNLLQISAYLPGLGKINLLHSPNLADTKQLLDDEKDIFGNKAFTIGSAILLPYANRIRGKLTADGQGIETIIAGKPVCLPANWQGQQPGAEKHAMHGLMLSSRFQISQQQENSEASTLSGILHAGDFGGHWLSQTDVNVKYALQHHALDIQVTAKNSGEFPLPMGIGAHPYFAFPSGKRQQVQLHLPAAKRAPANNYDDVFPTGKLESVKGTPFDFTAPHGKALGDLYLDDCFTDLQRNQEGAAVVTIIDPAANFGLHVMALSPAIKAMQVYAPPDKNFIAIEPQFNLVDPYAKTWGDMDTGMVLLQPQQSISWQVRLALFLV